MPRILIKLYVLAYAILRKNHRERIDNPSASQDHRGRWAMRACFCATKTKALARIEAINDKFRKKQFVSSYWTTKPIIHLVIQKVSKRNGRSTRLFF